MKRIALHSAPRSGSSWIGQILNSAPNVNFKFQPLFSYEFKSFLNEKSSIDKIDSFFDEIAESENHYLLQNDKIKQGIYPSFKKNTRYSHIVYKEVRYHYILENLLEKDQDILIVGIIRNPFATINSFLQSPKEFRKDLGWQETKEWQFAESKNQNKKEEFFGYMKWQETAFLFLYLLNKYPERFYLIDYDKIILNTDKVVSNLFDFCDIRMTEQTKDFVKKCKSVDNNDIYSVYRKKIFDGDWRRTLDPNIALNINVELSKSKCLGHYLLSETELKTL